MTEDLAAMERAAQEAAKRLSGAAASTATLVALLTGLMRAGIEQAEARRQERLAVTRHLVRDAMPTLRSQFGADDAPHWEQLDELLRSLDAQGTDVWTLLRRLDEALAAELGIVKPVGEAASDLVSETMTHIRGVVQSGRGEASASTAPATALETEAPRIGDQVAATATDSQERAGEQPEQPQPSADRAPDTGPIPNPLTTVTFMEPIATSVAAAATAVSPQVQPGQRLLVVDQPAAAAVTGNAPVLGDRLSQSR